MKKPLIIAHRGDRKQYPDNSMEAFVSAFQQGADGIELDVQIDTDGQLIIVHDYIYDSSQSYLLLSDVLKQFVGMGRIEMELKFFEKEGIGKLAEIIDRFASADIEITSSITPLLAYVKEALPQVKTGLIFQKKLLDEWMTEKIIMKFILGYLRLTRADILHLDLSVYTPAIMLALKHNNQHSHTHLTSASLTDYQKVVALGIDQCTVDDLSVLEYR